jgi:hypothetical protein
MFKNILARMGLSRPVQPEPHEGHDRATHAVPTATEFVDLVMHQTVPEQILGGFIAPGDTITSAPLAWRSAGEDLSFWVSGVHPHPFRIEGSCGDAGPWHPVQVGEAFVPRGNPQPCTVVPMGTSGLTHVRLVLGPAVEAGAVAASVSRTHYSAPDGMAARVDSHVLLVDGSGKAQGPLMVNAPGPEGGPALAPVLIRPVGAVEGWTLVVEELQPAVVRGSQDWQPVLSAMLGRSPEQRGLLYYPTGPRYRVRAVLTT